MEKEEEKEEVENLTIFKLTPNISFLIHLWYTLIFFILYFFFIFTFLFVPLI